jgi:hypothetical protein
MTDDVKLSLPDRFEALVRENPREAFELLVAHLDEKLRYRTDRGTREAIRLALQIVWTVGQRDGIQSVIDEALDQAKETQRHDH